MRHQRGAHEASRQGILRQCSSRPTLRYWTRGRVRVRVRVRVRIRARVRVRVRRVQDLARRLEVLDDAHREVAAFARLVHAQGEACRRAQPEGGLARIRARVRTGWGRRWGQG